MSEDINGKTREFKKNLANFLCSCIFLLLLMALAYREDGESLHIELEGGEFD